MNEFKVIVVMNEAMLKTLKDKNANYEENLKIQKHLEDESLFSSASDNSTTQVTDNADIANIMILFFMVRFYFNSLSCISSSTGSK